MRRGEGKKFELKNPGCGWDRVKEKSAGVSLLQDEVLEFFGEVKDSCYVQERDDELCFCRTKNQEHKRLNYLKMFNFGKQKLMPGR